MIVVTAVSHDELSKLLWSWRRFEWVPFMPCCFRYPIWQSSIICVSTVEGNKLWRIDCFKVCFRRCHPCGLAFDCVEIKLVPLIGWKVHQRGILEHGWTKLSVQQIGTNKCCSTAGEYVRNGDVLVLAYSQDVMLVWLVVWILGHLNPCRLFNTKSIFIQIISSISNNSVKHTKTVPF